MNWTAGSLARIFCSCSGVIGSGCGLGSTNNHANSDTPSPSGASITANRVLTAPPAGAVCPAACQIPASSAGDTSSNWRPMLGQASTFFVRIDAKWHRSVRWNSFTLIQAAAGDDLAHRVEQMGLPAFVRAHDRGDVALDGNLDKWKLSTRYRLRALAGSMDDILRVSPRS